MVGFAKATVKKKAISQSDEKTVMQAVKDATKQCKTDKEIAEFVKLALDDTLNGPWNVIVGQKFGGVIAYIPNHFMYFEFKKKQYLIYCTRNMKGSK